MSSGTGTKEPSLKEDTSSKKNKNKSNKPIFILLFFLTGFAFSFQIFNQSNTPNFTEKERIELESLESKMESRVPLENWEKERFCDLLNRVKGIKLFACKENYFCNIGSLTGYKVGPNDIDWRGH